MRFIEIPALITEDIEDPSIVDITEPISASISGTTMTIDGGSKVSGEATVTLTGDTTVNAFTLQNIRAPSLHKISVKTNKKGNFTYVPNDDVTASSLSTTSKTGSDFEILLITTPGNPSNTYVDFDMADYTSPAVYTSNALTGFDVSELTSTYGATAKLYKPDGTLLTTVSSAETGSTVNFNYSEQDPQDVTYTLEVTDDLGRTSRYDLPRRWISYAMQTNETPGFEKLALAGNEYTTTTIVPNLTSSSKARIYKTGNHGYLGINFKIQGRNSTDADWQDIDSTGENENADESKEFQAFGDYLYHRVWVKPTAKATTTVTSSNVVTLTLSNLTEENLTTSTSFVGLDPYDINESTNTYVFEETTKIGTIPFTVTLDTETYTNAFTATTEGTAYDYVTLAFANPTLSLTTSNVTISSAKLYRDDVLFHTYGTESNVVLRTDQTGTYQAIVNDVYYSNRVTPDFTTTRSVSAPQLEFDGYNKLSLNNITPTSSTLGLPDGTTRDLTTQTSVYIYETGTYTANVQSSDTFAYLSNVVEPVTQVAVYDYSQALSTEQKITASDAASSEIFGRRCAISGDYMVVTASSDNSHQGAAYIFTRSGSSWVEQQKLFVSGLSSSTEPQLGHGVDISGDTVIVGAYEEDTDGTNAGGAYIFTRSGTTWSQPYRIVSDDIGAGHFFGYHVSIDGDYVIVGSHGNESAYIFKRDGSSWIQQAKLTAESDATDGDYFGRSVSIYGDYAVVGAWKNDDNSATDSGSVYIFVRNGTSWSLQQKLTAGGDAANYDYFGEKVSINGDYVIVSAYGKNTSTGASYIFKRDGTSWSLQQKLTASDGASSDSFGWSVAIKGDYAIVGAQGKNTSMGAAYIFKRNGTSWTQQAKLVASDGASNYFFGNSVAIDGGYVVIGSRGVNSSAGAAYIYTAPNIVPSITFDNYNRLAIENITQTSSTLEYGSNTYDTNTASNVYVTDAGEYKLEARDANTFVMSNVYVGAVDTIPEFTLAFHHGTFADSGDPYSDGSVTTAATNGHVFADTVAGMYTWGTLAHVKERENPDFTANSTLHTDYSSTYGWTTNSGWEVSAKDEFSSTYAAWNAFNKGDGAANNNWLSGSAPSENSPQWLKIKYPSTQVIKSYVIKARDNASPRFPTAWKLQGSNNDSDWTDIGTEQTVSLWSVASEKSFDVSSNTTAYQYYRLRITGARESASLSNSDYVAIGQWFLNTVNDENTTNHEQYTRYTYTPSNTITANVLRVAGGGGGGGVIAGGGGAGGLLYSEGVSLSGSKTITVGNGGSGGKGYGSYPQGGTNGSNTTFTGLTDSIGGGSGSGGGGGDIGGTGGGGDIGGSGGGGSYNYSSGGLGTASQGNAGGNGSGSDGNYGGGGGGAGGAGGNGSSSTGGTGGIGLDYTSIFGTTYGDSGWFASGGGGGGRSGTGGTASNGGGTSGTGTSVACDDAQKHTGGGGGGAGYNNSQTAYLGGDGGSGIVLIKKLGPVNPPTLTFDGYNKLTIDNVDSIETATIKKDGATFATTTSNTVYIRDTGTYTAEVKGPDAYAIELSKEVTGSITSELEWKTNETQVLYPDSVTTEDLFGNSIAFDGNYAIIGANNNDFGGDNRGMVYIFYKSGGMWTKQANFQSKHINNVDNFGWSVDISGDYAIIGAFLYDEVFPDAASNRGAAYIFKREGNEWRQQTQLQPSDPGADDYFGYSVKISGDYAIVGSPYNNDPNDSGSAYIFKKTSTTLSTVINPIFTDASTIETNANWSSSTGFEITASAEGLTTDSQKWRAFDNTYTADNAWESTWLSGSTMPAWIQIQYPQDVVIKSYTIVGRDATDRYYPTSWQLQGATASAPSTYINLETTGGNRTASGWAPLAEVSYNVNTPGTAYRYFRLYVNSSNEADTVSINELKLYTEPLPGQSGTVEDSWVQHQKLTANDAATYDEFGLSVDISGDYAIIGANSGDQRPGSAYIFKLSGTTWTQQDKIQADDGATSERFGKAVALSGDYAVVGAYNDNSGTGSAYIFKKDTGAETWTEQQKLTASDGASNDNFGWSVDIYGETAVVGAYRKNSYTGAAYIFERSGSEWTEVKNITASGGAGGKFGNEVFVDGTTVLIGSPNTDTKGTNTGACYVFNKTPPGPHATFDNYNKITLENTNYADTTNVTYYSNTYELGTAKTMYVKDAGEYVFKISGSDKYVESNVYVSSVDLAGASTKPIDFDGYNKLTLIDAGSNVSANVTYFSNTYELGSANVLYINGAGTYGLEMSGSNVFALSSNVVSTVSTPSVFTPVQLDETGDLDLGRNYKHISTSGTVYTFQLYNGDVADSAGVETYITYDTSDRKWRDAGTDHPNTFAVSSSSSYTTSGHSDPSVATGTDNAEYIHLVRNNGYQHLLTFKMAGWVPAIIPSLTFDTYNKLTLENFTTSESDTRTAKLTDPNDVEYTLGQTQNDIYIEETGDYFLEVTNSDQSAVVKTNVGTVNNTVPESTITYPVYKATSDTQPSSYYTAAASQNKRYNDGVVTMDFFNYYNGALHVQWNIFDGITDQGDNYNLQGLFSFQWNNNVVKKVMKMRIYGKAPSTGGTSFKTEIKATSSDSWTTLNTYDRTTDYTNNAWNEFPINQEVNACRLNFDGFSGGTTWHHVYEFEAVAIDDSVPPPPSLTFDGYNKLSIENLTPTSTRLTYGSNTYEIGTASNVYIEHPGTYKMAMGDANTFALVSNVVTGSVGPGPDTIVAFHYGSFDSVYGDADVNEAANNGRIFDDTPLGTYSWGSLDSRSTASQQTTYTWTPSGTITADVLMVAGGGGGGNSDNNNGGGGGGGAGGLVYNSSVSLSGQKTITVGGPNSAVRGDGTGSSFTGLTSAVGGGKGAGGTGGAGNGGSGGGAYRNGTGGSGTAEQGNAGGSGSQTLSPLYNQGGSGGGGAGGAGVGATSATDGANGGTGLDYSSVFGTTYGDNGWFASGGAGGFHAGGVPGTASNGGGGDGGSSSGSAGANGQNHTGGGGGGGSVSSGPGSYGGSGIVLVKIPNIIPSLTYDTSNKLSIENITPTSTTLTDPNGSSLDIGAATDVYIRDSGKYEIASKDANTFVLTSNTVTGTPTGTTYSFTVNNTEPTPVADIVLGIDTTGTSTASQCTWTVTSLSSTQAEISCDYSTAVLDLVNKTGTTSRSGEGWYWAHDDSTNVFTLNIATAHGPNDAHGSGTLTVAHSYSPTFQYSGSTPSQTYDTTKTITVSDVPSTLPDVVGKIYKGSTAYPIHATTSSSNVIIKNTGSYVSVFTTATQAFLTNAIDVSTPPNTSNEDNTIEDEATLVTTTTTVSSDFTLAFHYGSFDSVYGDADVNEAVNNGRIFDDTPSGTYDWGTLDSTPSTASNQTTYTWTPTSDITGADVLIVAGGGGGGGTIGGGGGAGGVLHYTNHSLSGQKTIVIGNGGPGGYGWDNQPGEGTSGYNTTFTGFDNAIGGGGGSGHRSTDGASSGGSGGGGAGSGGASGTTGQGNAGGSSHDGGNYGAGGGGAGSSGGNSSGSVGGNGGTGLDKSSVFGTTYGDSGWFASGGGGGVRSGNSRIAGTASQGGGTSGVTTSTAVDDAQSHTGGGGGGAGHDSGGNYEYGGRGGSGIVLVKFTGTVTTTTTTVGLAGSTAVPDETATVTDTPSATLDATDTTVTEPTLNLDFTTTLPRTLKRYNGVSNSSIGARFNRRESRKKRIEKSISIPSSFSAELTANNASSPTTLTVTVANSKFVINGDETPTLGFIRGETYTFDQSDSSNGGHPLVLATSADGATLYESGWVNSVFTVPYDVPDTIYYKCTTHNNMGGEIHTTFGNAFSLDDFTVASNTHVSGEYTLAVNYDGTTSNLYVNGSLITQTTRTISAGTKDFILGKEFDGYVKNFKFWNYAKHFILFTNPNFTGEGVLNSFSGVTLEYVDTTGVYANYIWKTSSGNIVTDSGVKFNVVERRWYDVRTGDETDANNKPYHFEIRQGNANSGGGGNVSNPSEVCINGNLVIFRGINDDNDWLNSIYMSGIV